MPWAALSEEVSQLQGDAALESRAAGDCLFWDLLTGERS